MNVNASTSNKSGAAGKQRNSLELRLRSLIEQIFQTQPTKRARITTKRGNKAAARRKRRKETTRRRKEDIE